MEEGHSEAWTAKVLYYLSHCNKFVQAAQKGLICFQLTPNVVDMAPVPRFRWLSQVYLLDVLLRLADIKAAITSASGCVLKIDSTKKVSNKLSGAAGKTALWMTNVGNEHGQVLASVLTSMEGRGLQGMMLGLVERYKAASMPPPQVLYVDRDCCGNRSPKQVLSEWPNLFVRLDVWHFMRRLSAGVTTESHPLYASFMSSLSQCLFQWDHHAVTTPN